MNLRKILLPIGVGAGLAGYSLLIFFDFILFRLLFLKKNPALSAYNYCNSRLLLRVFGKERIRAFNSLEVVDRVQSVRLPPDTLFEVTVRLKNTSDRTTRIPPVYHSFLGQEGPLRIGTSNPRDRDSALFCDRWVGRNRLQSFGEIVLGARESIPLTCAMKTPPHPGTYQESFGLVYEGFMWLPDQCVFRVDVEVV
jgi:hypothetical protein